MARLPLCIVEEEGLAWDDISAASPYRHPSFTLRHGYPQSLATHPDHSWLGSGDGKLQHADIGLRLPHHIATKPSRAHRRYRRSPSDPCALRTIIMSAEATVLGSPTEDADTAPNTPPDLSSSKSSKSSNSSVRSDSSDDEDAVSPSHKLSHFEDSSIEDVSRFSPDDSNLRPESRPTLKRPPPRSMTAMDLSRTVSTSSMGMPSNRYPPPLHGAERPLNPLPNGLGLRRGFSSPSAPSLFTLGSPRMHSSRSPSPTKPFMYNGVSVSPQALAGAIPKLPHELRSPNGHYSGAHARRKSWQTGQRKTAKEIEADFNDDDGEVPIDAILENVPITPMPGQPRLSQSSRPQSRSTTPSPQRRPSYTNLHSANVPKGARRPSAPSNGQYGSARSPRNNRPYPLQHTPTMPVFQHGFHPKQRSKSWTEDLSEEARELSRALEAHAELSMHEKHGSGANSMSNSVSSSPPEPSFLKQRAQSATFELPMAQKGNVMIDPLPISKEKEAVLTRTRPSWLPPKSQKEEKKHMKEWEQMMARAAENERKRAIKQKEEEESQIEVKDSIARLWEQHVLPHWELVVLEPRTRELWWRGVAPKNRGTVWQRAIGNELELSEASFNAALLRANELEEKVAEMAPEERDKSKEAAWLDAIYRDAVHACPHISSTSDERIPFEQDLANVLKAYAMYRSDVGYVYGSHLVAGMLCYHLRPADAFVTLANMLNRAVPLAFHVHDVAVMARTYELVLSTLKYKFPKLHGHLTSSAIGLRPEDFLDPIFRCLFAYHLPLEHASRVWDIFVFEGDKALVRAAVAVLGRLEGKLYGTREEVLDLLGWRNEKRWDLGNEEEFIAAVREAGKVDSKGEAKDS